jgi:hypothetical protein
MDVINPETHSHPIAARNRTRATHSINKFCHELRRPRFDYSTSDRERCSGQRDYHVAKDFFQDSKQDVIHARAVVTLVDVDYYLDHDDWSLLLNHRPVLMYTFRPKTLAGRTPNGSFWFSDSCTVHEVISGGERYVHQVWSHEDPLLIHPTRFGWTLFNVDRMEDNTDDMREFILLTPRVWVFDPFGLIGWLYSFRQHGIKRMVAQVDGDVMSLVRMEKNGRLVRSLKTIDMRVCVDVDEATYQALVMQFNVSKWKNISDVEKFLMAGEHKSRHAKHVDAAILFGCLEATFKRSGIVTHTGMCPVYQIAPNVLQEPVPVTEVGKASVEAPLPSIMQAPAQTPANSYTNDVACVQMRVTAPHNETVPPHRYERYAEEFARWVVPDDKMGTGFPWMTSEVWQQQDRPLQRMRSERTRCFRNETCNVSSFQKFEHYAGASAPRNISTVPVTHTHELSAYTYPFKKSVLVKCKWYHPCRNPGEISDSVMSFVRKLDRVLCTDYSNYDGTISLWLREHVERRVYLRWVRNEDKSNLNRLLMAEVGAKGMTKHGVRYRPKGARLSGSPLTTDANSLINAFASYCGFREAGWCLKRAYFGIGPKYGDDSIENPLCAIERAATDLGLKIKCEYFVKGQPVPYLGRVFLDPWISKRSIQDPMRTMKKIHLVHKGTSDLKTLRCNRVAGYLVTDENTPVIGHYCRMVKRVEAVEDLHTPGLNKELDYRVRQGQWPVDHELQNVAMSVVADSLGVTVSDVVRMCSYLDSVLTYEEVPVMIHNDRLVKFDAIIDGELVLAD